MNGYELVRLQPQQVKKTGDTMTGNLTMSGGAKFVGGLTGNADTATKLATARTIRIAGDATGSNTFDGSADKSISITLANSGVTAGSYGQTANATVGFGGTISVPQVTVDAKGRVTSAFSRTVTLPANPDSDTKVTNTLNTTVKAYVTGTTSATTNTGTQVFDTGVYLDTTAGRLTATSFNGDLTGNAATATKLQTARGLTVGLTKKNFDGSADVSWNLNEIGALPLTGGTLTGDLTIAKSNAGLTIRGKDNNYYKITHSSANGTLVFNYNTTGLFTVQNNGNIVPIGNRTMSIGDLNYRFSDVYVGSNTGDKNSGYSTLSNGYTLMWGSNVIPAYPSSTTTVETRITFPLATKEQCFPTVSSYDIDGKILTVRNLDATGFKVVVRNIYHDTPTWNLRINWYCLVKL